MAAKPRSRPPEHADIEVYYLSGEGWGCHCFQGAGCVEVYETLNRDPHYKQLFPLLSHSHCLQRHIRHGGQSEQVGSKRCGIAFSRNKAKRVLENNPSCYRNILNKVYYNLAANPN